MKTAKSSLEAANRVVPKIEVNEAIQKHAQGNSVFIDVRDGTEIAETGTIKGALKIPRGFIEFAADPETSEVADLRGRNACRSCRRLSTGGNRRPGSAANRVCS